MNAKDLEKLCDYLECNDASLEAQQEAAAELRRLHKMNQELLESLKRAANYIDHVGGVSHTYRQIIAKATGEQA